MKISSTWTTLGHLLYTKYWLPLLWLPVGSKIPGCTNSSLRSVIPETKFSVFSFYPLSWHNKPLLNASHRIQHSTLQERQKPQTWWYLFFKPGAGSKRYLAKIEDSGGAGATKRWVVVEPTVVRGTQLGSVKCHLMYSGNPLWSKWNVSRPSGITTCGDVIWQLYQAGGHPDTRSNVTLVCLWGCFWRRLTFDLVNWVKKIILPNVGEPYPISWSPE